MKQAVTLNWKLVGAELASMDCKLQAEFFTGFICELMSWDTHMQREMQIIAIEKDMSEKDVKNFHKYVGVIGNGEEQ